MQLEYSKFVHESKHSSIRPIFDTYLNYSDLKDILDMKKHEVFELNFDEKQKNEADKTKRNRDTKYSIIEEEEGETFRSLRKKKYYHKTTNDDDQLALEINDILTKKQQQYTEIENENKMKKYELINFRVRSDRDKERFRNGLKYPEIKQQMEPFFNKQISPEIQPIVSPQDEYHIQLRKFQFWNTSEMELPSPKFEFNKSKVQEFYSREIIEEPSYDDINNSNNDHNTIEENEEDNDNDDDNEEEEHKDNTEEQKEEGEHPTNEIISNNDNNDSNNNLNIQYPPKLLKFKFRPEPTYHNQLSPQTNQQHQSSTMKLNRNKQPTSNNNNNNNLSVNNDDPSSSLIEYKFISFSDSYMCFDKPKPLHRDYSEDIKRLLKDVSLPNKSLPLLNSKISIQSNNSIQELFVFEPIKTNPETGALESYLTEIQLRKRAKLLYPSRQDFIKEVINKLLKFLSIIKTLSESSKKSTSTERIMNEKTQRNKTKLNEIKKTKIVTFSDVNSFMNSPFGVYDMQLFQSEFQRRLKQNEEKKKLKRLDDLKKKMREALIQKEEKEGESDEDNEDNDIETNRDIKYIGGHNQTFRRRKDILPNELLNDAKILNGDVVYYPRKKMNYLDGLKMLIKEEASKSSRK